MAKEIDIGAYSAYAIAVEHGYEGTEAEFAAQLMNSAANGALAQDGAERAEAAAAEAEEILASIPEDYTELAGEVSQLSEENLLHADVIKGTVQTVTFNADGTPANVVHTATDGTVVRTDTFAYSADKIREVRDTGNKTLIILTDLNTLSVEVN